MGSEHATLAHKGAIEWPGHDIFATRPLTVQMFVYAYEDVKFLCEAFFVQYMELRDRQLLELALQYGSQRCELRRPPLSPQVPARRALVALFDGRHVICLQRDAPPVLPSQLLQADPVLDATQLRAVAKGVWPAVFGGVVPSICNPLAHLRKAVRIGDVCLFIAYVDSCDVHVGAIRELYHQSNPSSPFFVCVIDVVAYLSNAPTYDVALQYLGLLVPHCSKTHSRAVNIVVGNTTTGEYATVILHDGADVLSILIKDKPSEFPWAAIKLDKGPLESAIYALGLAMGNSLFKAGEMSYHMPKTAQLIGKALSAATFLVKLGHTHYFECSLPPGFMSEYRSSFFAARRDTCGFKASPAYSTCEQARHGHETLHVCGRCRFSARRS